MEGYVSVSQAARIKNVTRQAIYLAIRLKRLKAYKHEDQWKVFVMDLNQYDQNRYSRLHHSVYEGEPIYDESKGYFSVDKASKMINVPKQKLYYAIRTKRLKAQQKRSSWVVHVSDLLKYKDDFLPKDCTTKIAQ